VDFVMREGASTKRLIQVTYAGGRDEVEGRELEVITWDYEESVGLEGRRVRFLPLWRWLLS
jgi:hypothetical protein